MNKITHIILFFLAFSLTACDLESTIQQYVPQETVIVNLDAVAKALAKDEEIKKLSEENNKKLSDKLKSYANNLKSKIQIEKEKLPKKNISQKQKDSFQQLTSQASQDLQKAQAITRQQSQKFQADLINKFREQVQTYAKKIAVKRKAKIIISAGNNVLWYDPEIDITDDVISAMQVLNNNKTLDQ